MQKWFWFFFLYSFFGFLLEWSYAKLRRGHPDRKCLLVLPLCPVYGLGACVSLFCAPLAGGNPLALFALGALCCTAAEYVMAVWYERWIGVPFWNYAGRPGNLRGRVCLPFSLAWGGLVVTGYYALHPTVDRLAAGIPDRYTAAVGSVALFDALLSTVLLRRTRDRACLRWYDALSGALTERRACPDPASAPEQA